MDEIFEDIGEVIGDLGEVVSDAIDGLNPFHD